MESRFFMKVSLLWHQMYKNLLGEMDLKVVESYERGVEGCGSSDGLLSRFSKAIEEIETDTRGRFKHPSPGPRMKPWRFIGKSWRKPCAIA
jgi:hypothetical protein